MLPITMLVTITGSRSQQIFKKRIIPRAPSPLAIGRGSGARADESDGVAVLVRELKNGLRAKSDEPSNLMCARLVFSTLLAGQAAARGALLAGGAARAAPWRGTRARAVDAAGQPRMCSGAPPDGPSFAGLPVPRAVLDALASRGVSTPMAIQLAATLPLSRGDSALLHAPTGSGKTIAFLLPLLHRLHAAGAAEGDEAPGRVLVLVPGQELAVQIATEARVLLRAYAEAAGASAPLRLGLLIKAAHQLSAAEAAEAATASLLIATPNPLLSALSHAQLGPVLGLHETLVLDEVDALLAPLGKYATRRDKEQRLAHPRPAALALAGLVEQRLGPRPPPLPRAEGAARPSEAQLSGWRPDAFQLVALSATVGRPLREELSKLIRAPSVRALQLLAAPNQEADEPAPPPEQGQPDAEPDAPDAPPGAPPSVAKRRVGIPPTVSHAYTAAAFEDLADRLGAAAALLGSRPAVPTLLFMSSGHSVPKAVAALSELLGEGRPVRGLFEALGGLGGPEQAGGAEGAEGEGAGAGAVQAPPVLVATEESARGLDLPAVRLVLLLHLPGDVDRYVHLAGRTGRAGAEGSALCFVDWREKRRLASFQGQLGISIRPLSDDEGSWLPRPPGEAGAAEAEQPPPGDDSDERWR